jgi:hypothetical protein
VRLVPCMVLEFDVARVRHTMLQAGCVWGERLPVLVATADE